MRRGERVERGESQEIAAKKGLGKLLQHRIKRNYYSDKI